MSRILLAILLTALLSGCRQSETKVLLGGTLRPSAEAAAVEDSIIVITGATIRAVGPRKDIPVPQDSERTDMRGKWIVPGGADAVATGQPANLRVYDRAPVPETKPVREMKLGSWAR